MAKKIRDDDDDEPSPPPKSRTPFLIAGLAAGAVVLLLCCGGIGIGAFFAFRGIAAPDVIGRWENDEIAKFILDLRPDGKGTIEIPVAKVRINITHKLQGNELTISEAPGQNLDPGSRDAVARFQRTRVTRIGNTLRMEALAGPGIGQATVLKKAG